MHGDNSDIILKKKYSYKAKKAKSKDQTKVEWAFDSIQNPMGVATYEGIKIKDKLPSVEDLKKRLDMVEQELREYKENEEASAKDGNYTSNKETK